MVMDVGTIETDVAAELKPKRPHPRGRRGGRSARAARKPIPTYCPNPAFPLSAWPQPVLAVPSTTAAWPSQPGATHVHAHGHAAAAAGPMLVFMHKPPPPPGPPPRPSREEIPELAPLPTRTDSCSSALVPTLCALSVLTSSD